MCFTDTNPNGIVGGNTPAQRGPHFPPPYLSNEIGETAVLGPDAGQ